MVDSSLVLGQLGAGIMRLNLSLDEDEYRLDIVTHLPREIALLVLSYASVEDLCRAEGVSRSWHVLCHDHHLQIKREQYRLDFLVRKENVSVAIREGRRLSNGMITSPLSSPLGDLQRASPTPHEEQRRSSPSDLTSFSGPHNEFQSVKIYDVTRHPGRNYPAVSSKASKRRLKRY
eukprot:m.311485 g.311485  ORF g.311485 m.311485 type:complete len:176 (+) comp72850_c0_seq1:117-644(+)